MLSLLSQLSGSKNHNGIGIFRKAHNKSKSYNVAILIHVSTLSSAFARKTNTAVQTTTLPTKHDFCHCAQTNVQKIHDSSQLHNPRSYVCPGQACVALLIMPLESSVQ